MKKLIPVIFFSFFIMNTQIAWTQDDSGEGDAEAVQSEEAEAVTESSSDEEQPEAAAEEAAEESSEEVSEEMAEETTELPEEPTEDLRPAFLPSFYIDLLGGVSIIKLEELASNASLTANSSQFSYGGSSFGGWFPSLWGIELNYHSQPFHMSEEVAIDDRDARWSYLRLDGRYAFMLSENFALSPRIGISHQQSPYAFVESATSTFMSTFTQFAARGGADMFFQFDPKLLFSAGVALEYPLSTSIDSPNTLDAYSWKMMLTAQGTALYNFLSWLDAGVHTSLLMHNADVTISRTGATISNNRSLSLLGINLGVIIRFKF